MYSYNLQFSISQGQNLSMHRITFFVNFDYVSQTSNQFGTISFFCWQASETYSRTVSSFPTIVGFSYI